jgi:septation ring formation regulator EzrA
MWIVVVALVVVLLAVVVAASMNRGRRTPFPTVEDRPPGRD